MSDNPRATVFREIFRQRIVKFGLPLWLFIGGYDGVSSQLGLPSIKEMWGMSGQLLPWWGWLLVLQSILLLALFEYLRKVPAPNNGAIDPEEFARITDRLKRAEERLDGATVSEGVLSAGAKAAEPAITPTSYKGKPLVKLEEPERTRVMSALLAITDYLTSDFAAFLRPFQELRDYEGILKYEGGAGFHARVEAPRPDMRAFIDDFVSRTIKPYHRELLVAQLEVTSIKTKCTELWPAVLEVANVSQLLPEGPANGTALKPSIRHLGQVLDAIQTEVDRVLNEITILRLRVSRGEL